MTLSTETTRQMNLVYEHADDAWKMAAHHALAAVAEDNEYFTSLDVLKRLETMSVETRDLRALGPVMNQGARDGIMQHHGFIRRNDSHNRGTTVKWKSNTWKAAKQ